MTKCGFTPRKGYGPQVSNFRLPDDLRVAVQKGVTRGNSVSGALGNAFIDLRNDILRIGWAHRSGNRDDPRSSIVDRWEAFTGITHISPFDWSAVAALLAEEGYQPYVEPYPVPAVSDQVRSAAKKAMFRLRARPDLEPAYLELASRTIVAQAASDMADRIHGADADDLRGLMPLVCAVWSLGREVAAAEERGAGPGAVKWRLLAFQGMG